MVLAEDESGILDGCRTLSCPEKDSAGRSWPVSEDGELLAALRAAALLEVRITAALEGTELTLDRWRSLTFIRDHPDSSMADVIDALVIPSSTATRVIDALVDLGAIYRAPAAADRRRITMRISAQGQAMLRDVSPQIAEINVEELRSSFV